MTDLNRVVLIGRLTRDCDVSFSSQGTPIGKFAIAVNGYKDEVSYIDCVMFGKLAESIGKYMTKGKQLAIDGAIKQDRWEQDGQKRSRINIVVNNVQLLGGERQQGNAFDSGHSLGGRENMCNQHDTGNAGQSFESDSIPF